MRDYKQFCGVAKALDRVGERWTLLVVRDLIPGGRRFTDLLDNHAGLTPNLLSKRLKELEGHGLIEKRRHRGPGRAWLYELTELGRELQPVVLALGRFGQRYLTAPGPEDHVCLRWLMVSMHRRYQGGLGKMAIEFTAGPDTFAIQIDGEHIEVRDGGLDQPNLRLAPAHPTAMPRLIGRRAGARALAEEGAFAVEGEIEDFSRFAESVGWLS